MALVCTPGGASDNSYVTLADANTYFADRLNSTANGDWTNDSAGVARTDGVKSAALVTATRRIDEEQFLGVKTTTTQALKWPRVDVYDEDGIAFSSSTIPARVKEATYLTALELLKTDFLAENYMGNLKRLATGTVELEQFSPQGAGKLPSEALRLLRLILVSANGGRLTRA